MFKGIKLSRKLVTVLTITAVMVSSNVTYAATYVVKSGDSLWRISQLFSESITNIKTQNNLSSDLLSIGQKLNISGYINYKVQPGDTLWLISRKFYNTIDEIKVVNKLTTDTIYIGQQLYIRSVLQTTQTPTPNPTSTPIPSTTPTATPTATPTPTSTPTPVPKPTPVTNWPSVTYIVQAGDTVDSISHKFNVSGSDILKYNYMTINDWFNAGQKIAISGYAPRLYAVLPGEDSAPLRIGKLVDWFLDGQYLLKRGDTFLITDCDTGLQFNVRMLGGYNHSDIETVTANDTAIMLKLFGTWQWSPRAVVIFKDGMNIAASLSGMPHSFDTIAGNNMDGHCDLYLENSIPHGTGVDQSYVQEHYKMILKAAGY